MVSHVSLGFLQCRLGRSSTLCGHLKGPTQGAKETAHLRDIWHDLTVFYRRVELPQKRVVLANLSYTEISAGTPVGFARYSTKASGSRVLHIPGADLKAIGIFAERGDQEF
jgi:hypothetical protein